MTLRFAYRVAARPHGVLSLGGRRSRPRPIVPVSLVGPSNTAAADGLLDTGADDTVFPERFALRVGLDLSNVFVGRAQTAALANVPLRYAQVTLRLTDGIEQREWPAWVGFSSAIRRPLFGFAGFLQFFTATFYGDREEVELTINGLYPGS